MSSLSDSEFTLYLYLDIDNSWPKASLRAKYVKAAKEHNEKLDNKNKPFGFDLYLPDYISVDSNSHILDQNGLCCDLKVKAAMYEGEQPINCKIYATPSLEETPLRMIVNPRIVESDDRDNLHTTFDINHKSKETWDSDEHHRLLQIYSCTEKPFRVVIVDTVEELNK